LLQTVTQKDLVNAANNVSQTLFYDSLGRLIRTKQGLTFGSCTHSLSLYDAAGNVLASVCNYDADGNADPTTVAQLLARYNPAFPDKNRITLHTYDSLGRRVATTTDAGAPYAQTTLTAYDSLHRVTRSIANYVPNPAIPDPLTHRHKDFTHGPNNDQNLATDTLYNERSLVRAQVDVLGIVTLFGYDEADTLVKTIYSVSQPTYDNSYANGDPSLRRYVANSAPDQDIITTYEYDAAGNRVKTTDAVGSITFTGYDALNRPVRTVRSASQPTYNLKADPTLSKYVASSAPDQDLMDFTEYDALGRVRRTQDIAGSWTLFGYDGLGRSVKTIRAASQPTYDIARDPSLSRYVASSAPDQDIVTETVHDPAGRVLYTADVLGRRTWTGYDGLGRAVRRITNAVGQATDGGGKDPRSSGYNAVIDFSDRDLVAQTAFDSNGYTMWTQDPLGNKTWLVHDSVGRQVKTIANATGMATDGGARDPRSARYIPGSASDQDIVTETIYDGQGRVAETIDPLGNRTRYQYDALGRRIKTIVNLVTGTFNANRPDLDLTSTTTYDVAGRVIATTDVRGIQTTFTYDRAGRQVTRTEAAGTSLARTNYTCYDKAGRVLRTLQNWIVDPTQAPPNARDPQGNWLFNPVSHGAANDQNLITTFTLDKLGRQIQVSDPLGNLTQIAYDRDGQVESRTDALISVTKYRYDRLRRRTLVVQAYNASTFTDPASWYWDDAVGQKKWKDGKGTAITFGAANDRNLIVQVDYDKAGKLTALRDPRGNRTTTVYDLLDRRTALTNPLGQTWTTAYANRNGTVRTTMTNPLGHVTQHDGDHAGRPISVKYLEEDPKYTPDITFTYDRAGNRTAMHEVDDAGPVRNTAFRYDHTHRLTEVEFDVYGDALTIEVVSYAYDAGGLRTQVTRPDAESITYSYNARGELTSLTNWLSQTAQFTYDGIGRLATIVRSGITSTYSYDAASRLTSLSHTNGGTLASFAYTLNALGNRTGVVETQAQAPSGSDTHNIAYVYDALARLTQAIHRTGGTLGSGTLVRQEDYAFDVAGNRTQQQVNTGGGPTTTNYSYDAANRLTSDGSHSFTYDAAGRLTDDGQSAFTYVWDRASRLLSFGDNFAVYNGLDQRVEYTVDVIPPVTTRYVPDMTGGLWTVLASDTDNDITGYVHGPMGLVQQVDPGGASHWLLPDGQGNVRGVASNSATVEESRVYAPYGQGYGFTGSVVTQYGYTGEPTNENGLVYLRARHYHPTFGVFPNLDPLEGGMEQPLSLNRYMWLLGNVVNGVDANGLCPSSESQYNQCIQQQQTLETVYGIRTESDPAARVDYLTAQRMQNIYDAVIDIVRAYTQELPTAIAQDLIGVTIMSAIGIFRTAFGGTTLRLLLGDEITGAPANTPTANLIQLWLTKAGTRVHTKENIIHEFGHILATHRATGSQGMIKVWDRVKFNVANTQGWSDFNLRQNKAAVPIDEALADSFLFWVYEGRDPRYFFPLDKPGIVRRSYVRGGIVIADNGLGGTKLEFSPGILGWSLGATLTGKFMQTSTGAITGKSIQAHLLPNMICYV
jgi:RHS repeat-associated protein